MGEQKEEMRERGWMICGVRMWNGRLWPERARVILWRSRNTKSSTFFEAKTREGVRGNAFGLPFAAGLVAPRMRRARAPLVVFVASVVGLGQTFAQVF